MTTYSPIDLDTLPAPQVIEALDAETILAAIKADVIARAPELEDVLELESEPATKVLEAAAFRELLLRARINDAARAVMVAHATGADLDNLAALFGVERLEGESDREFRDRTQLSLEGFSTAGPVGAYEFHALAAHAEVKDVAVSSPAPGTVEVAVLARSGNGTPTQEVLDAVAAALNDEDVRPLTDLVQVVAADVVNYAITAELVFDESQDGAQALPTVGAAVQAYVNARHALGQTVSLSGIYAALHQPGVVRATLVAPAADLAVDATAVGYCSAINLSEVAE